MHRTGCIRQVIYYGQAQNTNILFLYNDYLFHWIASRKLRWPINTEYYKISLLHVYENLNIFWLKNNFFRRYGQLVMY